MWPNPQETADLVTFTEEILMKNFIFCAVHGRKNYEEQLKNMLVVHGRNLDIIPLTT